MKTLIGLLLGGALVLTLNARGVSASNDLPRVVVGTFDSRAVAVAYVRSSAFANEMAAQEAALERAKEAGDEARVAELEAWGPTTQRRIHEQGFGTAPVDDILARIEHELPAIADEAGVDVIVSKWALAHTRPAAKFVDLTHALAARFDPDEATLKVIAELTAREPLSADELADHQD